MTRIAVASRSFSNHPQLRDALSQRYEDVAFNDTGKTLAGEALINFLKDYDKAIIGLERMDADILKNLTRLKTISRFGVGVDMLDLAVMKQLGIKLASTPGANKRAVSELVIALAINLLRNIPQSNQDLGKGVWKQFKGRQLSGSSIGIIGMGAIGKDLALLLKSFNCNIFLYDINEDVDFCKTHNFHSVALDDLLEQADIVSLHIPLTDATRFIIDERRLNLMKQNAILINAARGGLVDEQALKKRLQHNNLFAAAFDVFEVEPPVDQELLTLTNFFATPHIGGSTEEAILAMGYAAIDGLEKAV
ncbi:MAG: phosphoglycerate dehydrogenase [Pseudomonadota bacterium]